MSDTTLTLSDFLLARIAEDKAAARETNWLAMRYALGQHASGERRRLVGPGEEAKRQIVELHEAERAELIDDPDECAACYGLHPCDTLSLLASVYADHPDYQQEWKS